jgi:hypothetical protein
MSSIIKLFYSKLNELNGLLRGQLIQIIRDNQTSFFNVLYQTYAPSYRATLSVDFIINELKNYGDREEGILRTNITKELTTHTKGFSSIPKLEKFIEVLSKYRDEEDSMKQILKESKSVLRNTKQLYGDHDISSVKEKYIDFALPLSHFNK